MEELKQLPEEEKAQEEIVLPNSPVTEVAVPEVALEPELPVLQGSSTHELVKSLFKDEYGNPFVMTPGQDEIFDCIFYKQSSDGKRRIHIETHTQFGKSETVSMAVLLRAATFPEKWSIVAPSQPKAKIIMSAIIRHLFENEYTLSKFKIAPGENQDRIRRERSKNRLTFDIGNNQVGEVFILSAESRLKQGDDVGNALMGFGSPNIVMDEAALISDESDAKAMRMVGGFTSFGTDFVCKIGNPFAEGKHFRKSFEDPNYYKIVIDYERGIKEGRLTSEFIEEMRNKPFFRVLYECKFPVETDIDIRGWSQLLTDDEVEKAMLREDEEIKHVGWKRIGNDVARGGANQTVWALRSMNYAEILGKSNQDNLTEVASQTMYFAKQHKVEERDIFIDDVGVGGGAVDPLLLQGIKVNGVNVGERALEEDKYANLRAEAYWRLREWIKKGGRLSRDEGFFQLTKIKYKPDAKGRLRIMSKDLMRAAGIDSPDCFIAGTKIDIPGGKRNIEDLKKGDSVITPFGIRKIIKTWEDEIEKVYTVKFSNGTSLTGKGKHKIFTKRGFIRLDALVLNDIIETNNKFNLFLWKLKKLLYIGGRNIGFLKQANIIMRKEGVTEEKEQNLPYIMRFGKILQAIKFLKDIPYIISTIIPIIIPQRIFNVLNDGNICVNTWKKGLMIQNIEEKIKKQWLKYDRLPFNGIKVKSEESGIKNMEEKDGKIEKRIFQKNVFIVKKDLRLGGKEQDFVQEIVIKIIKCIKNITIPINEFVYSVKRFFWQIGIGIQNVVVIDVQAGIDLKRKVFNLTLDEDNAYYANGVLVNNCADALMLCFIKSDRARRREERQRSEREMRIGKGFARHGINY